MKNETSPSGARRFGYFVTILVNIAMIYVANNLLNWGWPPFLTKDYVLCLWAANLSFAANIFINFIFMFFDRRWFRSLMQAFGNVFGFLSIFVFWQVFPLDLSSGLASMVNLGLIIIMGLTALGTLVELISAVKLYNRDNR
jgi:hypothetical protein